MVSREIKSLYYHLMKIPMRLNGIIYRYFRCPQNSSIKVHLGPGKNNYINGWVNIDANFLTAKIDVWANLTDPLPFPNNSVNAFYSHHVIEHLPDYLLPFHFSEMYRCLKIGGIIRIGGPNGDTAIKKYIENDKSWFGDWPDKRNSIGGRFANFIFCRGEHFTILTHSYLKELLSNANFDNIKYCRPCLDTNYPKVFDEHVLKMEQESTPEAPHTLIIEAEKIEEL